MASLSAAAAHVFLSTTRFKELVDIGAITRQAPGKYDLDVVRRETFARDLNLPRWQVCRQGGDRASLHIFRNVTRLSLVTMIADSTDFAMARAARASPA